MQDSLLQDVVDAKDSGSLRNHLDFALFSLSIAGGLRRYLWPGNPKANRQFKEDIGGEVLPNLGAAPYALSTCH